MPNHVHLVMVPADEDGLRAAIAEAHRLYTRKINFREGWRGHLWQERFHSFALDESHLLAVVRYVERDPVKAKLVDKAQDSKWLRLAFVYMFSLSCAGLMLYAVLSATPTSGTPPSSFPPPTLRRIPPRKALPPVLPPTVPDYLQRPPPATPPRTEQSLNQTFRHHRKQFAALFNATSRPIAAPGRGGSC